MGHKTREWGERTAVCVGETHKKRERTQRKAFTHSGGHKIRTKFLQVFCTCCCSCLLFLLLLLLLKQHVVCCCIVCHCRSLRRSRSQMGSLFVPALWAPRSMLTAKNRSPTPPLSPTKDDQSLEALLDESGEMHETVRNPLSTKRRDTRLGLWVEEIMAKFLLKLVIPVMPLVHMLHH